MIHMRNLMTGCLLAAFLCAASCGCSKDNGGGEEGVKCYIDKLAGELADTMQMCGAHSIEEITPDMVRV